MFDAIAAGWHAIEHDGASLQVHLARPVRKLLVFVGPKVDMPYLEWQLFLPESRQRIAWGTALSKAGALSKARKAFTDHVAARRRWLGVEPYTDDALRVDWPHA